jgi:hypothetical protein
VSFRRMGLTESPASVISASGSLPAEASFATSRSRRSRVPKTLVAPGFKAVGNGKAQLVSLSLGRERGGRQQEVVEGPEGPTALDPDISGTKPIPKRHHLSDLPSATVNNGPCPDQLAPRRRQKGGRYPCWELPLPGSVELAQHLKGAEKGIGRLP